MLPTPPEETGADFISLRDRRRRVAELAEGQLEALQKFHYGADLSRLRQGRVEIAGFALNPVAGADAAPHLSISSTATCIRSLLSAPSVGDRADYTAVL